MGFPSPAADYAEKPISLDELCITRRSSTYFFRADAAYPALGISHDALLVVDSGRTPADGSVVIADYNGEYRIFVLQMHPRPALTDPASRKKMKMLDGEESVEIFGVVTYAVNNLTSFEFDDVPV